MLTPASDAPGRACPFAPDELDRLAAELEHGGAEATVRWAMESFHPHLRLACSFGGAGGMVLLQLALQVRPDVHVFVLDTGLLFPETYALIDEVERRYEVRVERARPPLTLEEQAARHGDALWERDPDRCCALRKVGPNAEALGGDVRAWLTAIRREQTENRGGTRAVEWNEKLGLVKVSPLVGWSERDAWRYLAEHDVPHNPLLDRGYASLGCWPCTRPVAPGEDSRAGRWAGFGKTECGLHT